jgi:hypothetical protein
MAMPKVYVRARARHGGPMGRIDPHGQATRTRGWEGTRVEPPIHRLTSLGERTPNGQYQLLVLAMIPGALMASALWGPKKESSTHDRHFP